MSAPASAVFKQLAYKAESTYGTVPSASGAQSLPRVSSTLDLNKDTYQSDRINTNQQVTDFRHGVRRVSGQITDELSPATYKDFIAQALRRNFTAVSALTGLSVTISGSGPYTVARGSGSFLTGGLKVGYIVRLTAGSFTAGNLNKNLLVTAVTALELTVTVLNASSLTAEGPIASATLSVPGKITYIPTSGHTDQSFAIEHWHSDNEESEVFSGCKAIKIAFSLPPSGMAKIALDFVGKDITPAQAQYFTSPTAASATSVLAAVNGALRVGGAAVANVTGLTLDISSAISGDPVVGSNTIPNQFADTIRVSGQATVKFDSTALRDAFINETEVDIVGVFTSDNAAASDFISFVLSRVKVGGAAKNDGPGAIVQTIPFVALFDSTGGSGADSEATTITIQDSAVA